MKFQIMPRIFTGLAFAGVVTFIAITILVVNNVETDVSEIWLNMLGSMILGVYFSLASLFYEIDSWSLLKQTITHLTLSLAVFYTIAGFMGWVPFTGQALLVSTLIFLSIYFVFWFSIRLYLKRMTADLNKTVN
ncbi:DUF3021 domain-containing protein [Halobacillus sp. A5]|uniref:DUF3021 domain-containing protein n=1 Tax=Halobacillus sp. A5 TaxID=2880263 RepID=UPI0020A67A98|nr:DUF3021 domain-containing protein [Halobacillus sp. A5]MCP3027524.1 DUF3021 domain-containing protein [Halobacillus sp. A5]